MKNIPIYYRIGHLIREHIEIHGDQPDAIALCEEHYYALMLFLSKGAVFPSSHSGAPLIGFPGSWKTIPVYAACWLSKELSPMRLLRFPIPQLSPSPPEGKGGDDE